MTTFYHRLTRACHDSLLCVGLDPDLKRLPQRLKDLPQDEALWTFCTAIIDQCAPFASCFKPQIAYFASQQAESVLSALCVYIKTNYPQHILILDAKRGDIGSTAEHYAQEAFERYRADAVTLSPYMGGDTIAPFLNYRDKGVFLLCRTSNPGAGELQDLTLSNGRRLYEQVAWRTAQEWDHGIEQCGLVVGATAPTELAQVRALAPQVPILAPGIGAQAGDLEATVRAGIDAQGRGLLVNSARAILYASAGDDYAQAAASVAQATHQAINRARALHMSPLSSTNHSP